MNTNVRFTLSCDNYRRKSQNKHLNVDSMKLFYYSLFVANDVISYVILLTCYLWWLFYTGNKHHHVIKYHFSKFARPFLYNNM